MIESSLSQEGNFYGFWARPVRPPSGGVIA
jgi:hypothetical protein